MEVAKNKTIKDIKAIIEKQKKHQDFTAGIVWHNGYEQACDDLLQAISEYERKVWEEK